MHVTGWGLPDPGQGIPVRCLANSPNGPKKKKKAQWLAWIESAGKSLVTIRLYIHRSYTHLFVHFESKGGQNCENPGFSPPVGGEVGGGDAE